MTPYRVKIFIKEEDSGYYFEIMAKDEIQAVELGYKIIKLQAEKI
jgi:hypothetical protein